MKITDTTAAIVTGGASGLGEATARALAAQGAKVAIFDMNESLGEAVAADIGGLFVRVNVTDEAELDAAFAAARAAHGQERILVACAGIVLGQKTAGRDRETGKARAHKLADFRRVIDINVAGTFACLSRSAAEMLDLEPLDDGERGVMIATASVAAEDGQIGQAAYAASKGAIKSMTLPIARDLMNDGIRMNTILPGIMATPMLMGLPQNVQDALGASVPFPKRLARADEFAALALHMIDNTYLNAACIRLDGGLRMAPK